MSEPTGQFNDNDRQALELIRDNWLGGHPYDSVIRALAYIEELEAALRLIADDDYPEAWGKETATGMRDVARGVLRPTPEIGPRLMEGDRR